MPYGHRKGTRNVQGPRPASLIGSYHLRPKSAYSRADTEHPPTSSTPGGTGHPNAGPDHIRPQEVQPHPHRGRFMQGLRMPRQASRAGRQVRPPCHCPRILMEESGSRRNLDRPHRIHPQHGPTEPRPSPLRHKTVCRVRPNTKRRHQPIHRLRREEPQLLPLQGLDAKTHTPRTI